MKKVWIHVYNFSLMIYMIVCCSFFYKQFLTVKEVNVSTYSDLEYFVRDNFVLLVLLLVAFIIIVFNLFYIGEYYVFSSKEEIRVKRIVGYSYKEIVKDYYVKYIQNFSMTSILASTFSIVLLLLFQLPIVMPIVFSNIVSLLILSIVILWVLNHSIQNYKKGKIYDLKYIKKFILIVQFSFSIMLLSVSAILYLEVNASVSPYRNYMHLKNAWVIEADIETDAKAIDIDLHPEKYHTDVIQKLSDIYTTYKDHILVYFSNQKYNENLGNVVFVNDKVFEINDIDTSIFQQYQNSSYIPIVLGRQFVDVYKVGDVIENVNGDYVVSDILSDSKEMKILGPVSYGEVSSENTCFALFTAKEIEMNLYVGNQNFIHSLFIYDLSEQEVNTIKDMLSDDNLRYKVESITTIQHDYYVAKMIGISGYFLVGFLSFVFTLLGFICVIYTDMYSKEKMFATYKIVGYTNQEITSKYLLGIVVVLLAAYVNGVLLTYVTLDLYIVVSVFVLFIISLVFLWIWRIAYRMIQSMNVMEIIGGSNE